MLSRRLLNRTLVYQINREEAPPGNINNLLLEGKPTVQLSRTLGFPRRRTNVQQLTCKIDSSNSFYYLFFSFIILELKPLVLKGKVLGEKF